MIDVVGIVFAYHVTKPLQYFLDNVKGFICYSKVTPYIVSFDAIYTRNFNHSPEALVLKCSFVLIPPSDSKFVQHMCVGE